jgi:hypothetical protein
MDNAGSVTVKGIVRKREVSSSILGEDVLVGLFSFL